MEIDRTSKSYYVDGFTGKTIIFLLGLWVGRKYFQNPMKIGYKPTNLGNDFYYIRKSDARIIVKLDRTTVNSDIVGVALRSNTKNMETFATVVNSQCDTKIKINPKAY